MRSAPVPDSYKPPQVEVAAEPTSAHAGLAQRVGAFFLREFREILPPTLFFFIGFNLIVLTTNLVLANYGAQFASFLIATASALIVAKALLVANAMPVIRHYDRAPLIRPILFKTFFIGPRSSSFACSNIGSGFGSAEIMYSGALCRT
jgi:hypothetical protein